MSALDNSLTNSRDTHAEERLAKQGNTQLESHFVMINDIKIHYLSAGEGQPVLFLHGWPTNANLWRRIMPYVAEGKKAVAIDLPGFGQSDKPTEQKYTFEFYSSILDGFVKALSISSLDLVVHDMGGPIGLYWAVNNPARITKIALLNTLVFPELSWAAKLFMAAVKAPFADRWLVGQTGLKNAMKFGVNVKTKLDKDTISLYQMPYNDKPSRQALLKSAQHLHPKGLAEIAGKLDQLNVPLRIICGENDRILPDIKKTMNRIKTTLPQAEITYLSQCGHFLQEDQPETVAELLCKFLFDETNDVHRG